MVSLPPERTPLYNHPLPALEAWLRQLGARQDPASVSAWELAGPDWTARIVLESEDLAVYWSGAAGERLRRFPYGLGRTDVEAAILAGP
jgi:hypothetical protein